MRRWARVLPCGGCFASKLDTCGQRSGSTDPRSPPFRHRQPKEYEYVRRAPPRRKTSQLHKTHMMKLLIALALAAAPSALAFTQYMPSTDEPTAMPSTSPTKDPTAAPTAEKNGCGELCANVITIELQDRSKEDEPFYVESGTCYVVDGTPPEFDNGITVLDGVNCAKITIPSGSGTEGIGAHLRVRLCPTPRETLRRGARRSSAITRRSSSTERSTVSRRASRVHCFCSL